MYMHMCDVPESFWGGKTEKVDVEANLPCLQGQELEPSVMNSKSAVTSQLPPLAPMVLHGCTTPRSAEGSILLSGSIPSTPSARQG